jgi:hypothetical protein
MSDHGWDEGVLSEMMLAVKNHGPGQPLHEDEPGFVTYPGSNANRHRTHEACTELERRNLIRRGVNECGYVRWLPVEGEEEHKTAV